MANYKHILITTDLSPQSHIVADKALEIAERFSAKISIIHVIEHSPMVYGSGEFAIPLDLELEESLESDAKLSLRKQCEKLNVAKEDQWLLVGSKKAEIVKLADELGIDLVCVGAHDKHGLGLLMGSTADSIVHALPCDVLSIKVDAE